MNQIRTIAYDDKAAGRKIIPFPPELSFYPHLEELGHISVLGSSKDSLLNLAQSDNIYELSRDLVSFISLSEDPYVEILRIAAIAVLRGEGGIRLLYALFMAIPPLENFLDDLIDFQNTARVMRRIESGSSSDEDKRESEDWFSKKVKLLSVSLPLPPVAKIDPERPWLSWSEGVRKAIADPDPKWEDAIVQRAKIELEAKEIRIRNIIASVNPESKPDTSVGLGSIGEEIAWKKQVLEETAGSSGSSTMFLKSALGQGWDSMLDSLRMSKAGALLAEMLEVQASKTHTFPQIKNGTALIRALLMHPALQKTSKPPDILSCLYLMIINSGGGLLEILLPIGRKASDLEENPGFSLNDRLLSIDMGQVNSAYFTEKDLPVDVDWSDIGTKRQLSYKSLVISYIDNDSFLGQILNNPKATNQPGLVGLIAQRCRSLRILSLIANRRDLHTGFNNKVVPMFLVMSPAKIPLTTLRKFIHIRYIDKMSLIKLSQKGGGQVREEVRREIERYLRSNN